MRLRRFLTPTLFALGVSLAAVVARTELNADPRTAIAVLQSSQDPPEVRGFSCPFGRCRRWDVESFTCAPSRRADTVVLTGHSAPPVYLNHDAEALASTVACFAPRLVVLDSCYAFSAPLLEALSKRLPGALVVGPRRLVPPTGLAYGPEFFAAGPLEPAARANAVSGTGDLVLERWVLDPDAIAATRSDVATWPPARLEAGLQRVLPNLVRARIAGSEAVLLEVVPPERFVR